MAETVSDEEAAGARSGTQAFLVVLLLGGLAALLLLTLAFSSSNTRPSVGGTEATYSELVDP